MGTASSAEEGPIASEVSVWVSGEVEAAGLISSWGCGCGCVRGEDVDAMAAGGGSVGAVVDDGKVAISLDSCVVMTQRNVFRSVCQIELSQ